MDQVLPRLTSRTAHVCVDMQRLFSHDGPWSTPLLLKVVPQCVALARYRPEATITRFVTPVSADGRGSLEGVPSPLARTTRARIDPALLELVPELASFVPPALVFDKPVYSAFAGRKLVAHLQHRDVDTVIPDGSRDRHLRAMLGAGRGRSWTPCVIATDAVCSFSDAGHDALLDLFKQGFCQQIFTAETARFLEEWRE